MPLAEIQNEYLKFGFFMPSFISSRWHERSIDCRSSNLNSCSPVIISRVVFKCQICINPQFSHISSCSTSLSFQSRKKYPKKRGRLLLRIVEKDNVLSMGGRTTSRQRAVLHLCAVLDRHGDVVRWAHSFTSLQNQNRYGDVISIDGIGCAH